MEKQTEKQLTVGGLRLQGFDQAYSLSERLAKSRMVPKDMQGNPGDVLAAILMGHEVGLTPMQALTGIAVINGRPCMYGDAVIGLVQASGLMEYIKEDNIVDIRKNQAAVCTTKRKGKLSYTVSFSMDDAKRAGLPQRSGQTGVWAKYPERMLQMRARAWCLRDQYADVLKGLSVREEVEDYAIETTAEPIREPQRPPQAKTSKDAPQAKPGAQDAPISGKTPETKPEPLPNAAKSNTTQETTATTPGFEGMVEFVRKAKDKEIYSVTLVGGEVFKTTLHSFATIAKNAQTAKKPIVLTSYPPEKNIDGFFMIKTIIVKS